MTRRDVARSAAAMVLAGAPLSALATDRSLSAAGLSMLRAREVSFDRHRLACYRGGEGPAVLLLHGNPGGTESWRLQAAPLIDAGFEIVAYDLLGAGRSSVSDMIADYAFENELAGAWRVLDAAGIDRLHAVIGHDRGGVLAWRMAAQRPERVNRLVTLSVGHPESLSDPDVEQIERFWYNFRFQFPDAEEFLRADDWKVFRAWMRNHPETGSWIESLSGPSRLAAFVNFWRANTNPTAPEGERVAPVGVPVTAIWSTGDAYCNERQMLRSESYATAGWTYHRVENASHFMQLDQPDKLNALLLDALRK